MAKLVQLTHDVYPYGCVGDVVKLDGDQVEDLEAVAAKRGVKEAYVEYNVSAEDTDAEDASVDESKANPEQLVDDATGSDEPAEVDKSKAVSAKGRGKKS